MTITLIRTVLLYALLILTVRLMGKRQVAELSPAEFVVTMVLADLVSVPMQDNALPLVSGLVPLFTILALELILSVLATRFPAVRRILSGHPIVLVENGRLNKKKLFACRISTEELRQKLREKDVYELSQLRSAVLETDGELSVELKGQKADAKGQKENSK